MDIREELRSLSRISENFRRKKNPKSKWPAEFQLRVLRLIDFGFSPQALSKKLNIPVQTYYHWRRSWKSRPQTNFIEVEVSDKLKDREVNEKSPALVKHEAGGLTLIFSNGARIENLSEDLILRILRNAV